MLLTNQPRVAQSIRNVSMLKSIRPVDGHTIHALCSAADNDARSIATVVKIRGQSDGTRGEIAVIAGVVAKRSLNRNA